MHKVIVIGGGPAGMTAAIFAARGGAEVTLLERNEKPGKKLFITGKGRCNLTNDCDTDAFFEKIPTNPRFLMSAVYAFTPQDVMRLFEDAGVPLKVERGQRVFPVSDKSGDIVRAMERMLISAGVRTLTGERASSLIIRDGAVLGVKCEGGSTHRADAVIIATGGRSYPATGSTGDGYELARSARHTVTDLTPSLVPIVTREAALFADAQGLSLKNVTLTLKKGEKQIYSDMGELLITHFGISGPLVLSASAHIKGDASAYTIEIDLKPALDEKKLDARILRDFDAQKNKMLKNVLGALVPSGLVASVIRLSGADGDKSVNSVTREERAAIIETVKRLTMRVHSLRGMEEAVVTRGGVNIKEIDPHTMQSRKVNGLFFAGEVMDVDGYTGGFNLQIAFSTGRLAGISCAEYCAEK